MRNLEFTGGYFGQTITIKQVQKRTALRLFLQGERVFVQSCNFYPFGVWSQMLELDFCERTFTLRTESEFKNYIRDFESYNCNNNESGRYASFYTIKK